MNKLEHDSFVVHSSNHCRTHIDGIEGTDGIAGHYAQ